jgi:hypothetical protein
VAVLALIATGCTSLREIPHSEYASQTERKHVRITTRDGLQYEFDYAQVQGDTLVGYRDRDVPGSSVEDMASLPVALEDITAMRVRGLDWYRTGLIGGGLLAALVAAGLTGGNSDNAIGGSSSGGGGGRVP